MARFYCASVPADAMGRHLYDRWANNLGDEGQDRVREAYGDAKYERLIEIKGRYDPENVFRHTSNIRPRA